MEKSKDKPKTAEELSEAALMQAIGFSPDDLAANQEGVLSDPQKFYLTQRRTNALYMGLVGGAIGILIVMPLIGNDFMQQRAGVVAVITFFVALLVISLVAKWYRLVHDIRTNQVMGVQGRVRLDVARKDYTLQIGDLRLNVNKDVFLAFKNGDPYAIYYAPATKMLLSAEWLREG